MKRPMLLRAGLALGILSIGVGLAMPAQSQSNRPPWVDPAGKVMPEKMPARIKIGTDLFAAGYGWLDSTAFQNPSQEGPYMVYESETSTTPTFWFYHGAGIVPMGGAASRSAQPQNTVSTAAVP